MYTQDSRQYESASKEIETQIRLVEFMKKYLEKDPSKANELIPSNTGLVDINIESQITQFNNNLLRRNRLLEGSNDNNPIVQELTRSIEAIRQNSWRGEQCHYQLGDQEKRQPTRRAALHVAKQSQFSEATRDALCGASAEGEGGTLSILAQQTRGECVAESDDRQQRTHHRPCFGQQIDLSRSI